MDSLIVVTDRHQAAEAGHRLADVVAAAVDGGARTVLLRDKDLLRAERAALATELLAVLRPVAGSLLIASDVDLARSVGAAGVHLAADPLGPASPERDPRRSPGGRDAGRSGLVVGRSCHSADELRAAVAAGLDYGTLSPLWPITSKPGYGPALGVQGLAAGCAAVPGFPVYALGGVDVGRVAACFESGAAGIAVMGAIMRAEDPGKVVSAVLEETP